MNTERLRPFAHHAPTTFFSKLKFSLRMVGDLQMKTIYRDLCSFFTGIRGKVLDVGCGNCPYEYLVKNAGVQYVGIDVTDAEKWDYSNSSITHFDGENIPFEDASFDHLMCTEVIEHVAEPEKLISEMHRVLKPGATAIITIPWSARFHYKPYDYHRYTPTMLARLFEQFSDVSIRPRGSDITAIANKSIVLYAGSLAGMFSPITAFPLRLIAVILFAFPVFFIVIWSHLALLFKWGSEDDPIGYTILLKK